MPAPNDWDAFLARYRPLALRIARGLAGEHDAEELVQEACRSLVERARRPPPLESAAHARNFLLRALRHRAITERRAATRRGPVEAADDPADDAPDPAALLADADERADRARRLRAALDELSAAEREAIDLRYGEGLAYKDMAARTGRAISTLQARVEAGLAKIRARLGTRPDGA